MSACLRAGARERCYRALYRGESGRVRKGNYVVLSVLGRRVRDYTQSMLYSTSTMCVLCHWVNFTLDKLRTTTGDEVVGDYDSCAVAFALATWAQRGPRKQSNLRNNHSLFPVPVSCVRARVRLCGVCMWSV